MNVPLIELLISEEDDKSGVEFVALVDRPAIQRNWMAFRDQNPFQFKVADEEKRRVMGPLMVPDQPIYRKAEQPIFGLKKGEEYYATFSAATIESVVKKFMRKGLTDKVNEMHSENHVAKDCYMIESFIIDSKRGIKTPEGFAELPDGSWFGTYQIDNPEIWDKIKAGKFMGFSIEGPFGGGKPDDIDMQVAEELINALINDK